MCVDIGKEKVDIEKVRSASPYSFFCLRVQSAVGRNDGKRGGGVGKKGIGLPNIHVADVRGARSHALIFVRKGSPTGFIVAHRKPRPGLPFCGVGAGRASFTCTI